ncbi:MAG: LysR family transcriptional regulator, partial [Flavobacteriia bacterium]
MNYTLNQLRIFLKIVQKESITRAAEALFLTQPAVSIQLKNFQDQFDIPLTEIVNKKLYVTDFGREVAAAAEKILEEVYAINYKTSQYKGQLSGRLRISVVSTGKYIIPYLLTDFLKTHPGVELVLDVSNRANVTLNLERNETDFSLVSVLPERLN